MTSADRYRVEFRLSAAEALGRLDRVAQRRVQGAIALLAGDPRPPGARRLRGRSGWRVRVGDHRVIYTIEDEKLIVLVVALGHRRDIYR